MDIRAERTPAGFHLTLTLGDWTWPAGQIPFATADLDLPDDDLNPDDFDEDGYPRIHFAPDLSEEDQDTVRRRVRMISRPVDRFRRSTAQDDTDPHPPSVLSPQDMEFPILHLTVSTDALLNFAHDLEGELQPFPVRVVEPNGDARRRLL